MRFCMVTTYYPPYHFGGDAIYVRALSRALVSLGHQVEVMHCVDAYRLKKGNSIPQDVADAGVIVHRDQIIKAPPLLQYMRSWTYPELKKFVTDHHWRIAELRVLRQDGGHTAGLRRVHGQGRRQGHRLRNAQGRRWFIAA